MKHKQDMNDEKITARLKKADPATTHELGADVIERGLNRASKKRSPVRRPSFVLAAAGAALVTASLTLTTALTAGNSGGPLISLGAQTDGLRNTMAGGPESGAGATSDKMMMMPNPFTYEYIAGEGLSTATSREHVYQVALSGDPLQHIKSLAKYFGIDGEVQDLNKDGSYGSTQYPVYSVGSQDGTGASVSIYWSGTGTWNYYNPDAYAEIADADSKLPSVSEARAQAAKIFKATGLSVSTSDIRVTGDEYSTQAIASLQLNGQDTAIEWYLNWGRNGEIGSASGSFVKLVDKGEFNTISAKDAVARIEDWRYSGSLPTRFWDEASLTIGVGDSVRSDLMPNPEASPELVKVTIEKAAKAWLLIWDASGNAWIVPGLALTDDRGWIQAVFTLEEGVVELADLPEVMPMDDAVTNK